MEIANIPVVLVDKFYFCMRHPIKAWFFEKIIFQLVYLFYIVFWNHLCSIKAGLHSKSMFVEEGTGEVIEKQIRTNSGRES